MLLWPCTAWGSFNQAHWKQEARNVKVSVNNLCRCGSNDASPCPALGVFFYHMPPLPGVNVSNKPHCKSKMGKKGKVLRYTGTRSSSFILNYWLLIRQKENKTVQCTAVKCSFTTWHTAIHPSTSLSLSLIEGKTQSLLAQICPLYHDLQQFAPIEYLRPCRAWVNSSCQLSIQGEQVSPREHKATVTPILSIGISRVLPRGHKAPLNIVGS